MANDFIARGLAARSSSELAQSVPGKGLDLIGRPSVAGLLASGAAARGGGAKWYADAFSYTEAADDAADHDILTQSGTKLYVDRAVPGYNVEAFGARGDGASDDTAAIQRAIDKCYAEGGGTVYFPKGTYVTTGIVLKARVVLLGEGFSSVRSPISATEIRHVTIKAAGTGVADWLIDTPDDGTGAPGSGIVSISIYGRGNASGKGGINFRAGSNVVTCQSLSILNFADEGLVATSLVSNFRDLFANNCLLNRARTYRTGLIRIEGADNYIERIEGNMGTGSLNSDYLVTAAEFVGSISGSVLSVASVAAGALAVDQWVYSGPRAARISSLGSGTGAAGTYNLDRSPGDVAAGTTMRTTSLFCCGIFIGGANIMSPCSWASFPRSACA